MKNKHVKCPRCAQRGTKWGGRRRRCLPCNLTWRVKKKRRGRKRLRHVPERAIRYLANDEPRSSRLTHGTVWYRRVKSCDALRRRLPWPQPPPSEPLILVADAFLQRTNGVWHTWYCIFARPVQKEDATILRPHRRTGTEVATGWQEAFSVLPASLLGRVKALVCDGHNGLVLEARRRVWLLQRCHFHLLARLQSRRSRWRRGFHQQEGKQIYAFVAPILASRSETEVSISLQRLAVIGRTTTSRDVRRMISGLVTNYHDYRTYLRNPELRLPTTSNTAEAGIGIVRELSRRARGFKTVKSFDRWVEAVVKTRKTIKCRPKKQPN